VALCGQFIALTQHKRHGITTRSLVMQDLTAVFTVLSSRNSHKHESHLHVAVLCFVILFHRDPHVFNIPFYFSVILSSLLSCLSLIKGDFSGLHIWQVCSPFCTRYGLLWTR